MRARIGGVVLGLALACAHRPPAPAGDVLDPSRAACERDDLDACVSLGEELWRDRHWRSGAEIEAFGVYERACGLGHALSCMHMARYLDVGCCGAPAKDEARAAALLERACDLGHPHACDDLALRYRTELHGPRDPARALRADERGCELGSPDRCIHVLSAYLHAPAPDWPAIDRALGRLACADAAEGCDNLRGLRLLQWYETGRPPPAEAAARREAREAHARALIGRGCEQGDAAACVNFASMLVEGVGGPADASEALRLYDRACEAGRADGCWGAARVRVREAKLRDLDAARAGFERACAQQDGPARRECRLAAAEVFAAAGARGPAAELFRPLCEGGDHLACVRWGRTLAEDRRSYRQAVGLFRGACTAGEPAGCARLARMMALGRGTRRDRAAADALAARACADGAAEACTLAQNLSHLARPAGKLLRIVAAFGFFPLWQIVVGDWW